MKLFGYTVEMSNNTITYNLSERVICVLDTKNNTATCLIDGTVKDQFSTKEMLLIDWIDYLNKRQKDASDLNKFNIA